MYSKHVFLKAETPAGVDAGSEFTDDRTEFTSFHLNVENCRESELFMEDFSSEEVKDTSKKNRKILGSHLV